MPEVRAKRREWLGRCWRTSMPIFIGPPSGSADCPLRASRLDILEGSLPLNPFRPQHRRVSDGTRAHGDHRALHRPRPDEAISRAPSECRAGGHPSHDVGHGMFSHTFERVGKSLKSIFIQEVLPHQLTYCLRRRANTTHPPAVRFSSAGTLKPVSQPQSLNRHSPFAGCRVSPSPIDQARRSASRVGIQRGAPHRQKPLRGLVSAVWGASERLPIDHGRTSPVGLPSLIALDAHAGSGGGFGLSRSIRPRIAANNARGTATSASWNTT